MINFDEWRKNYDRTPYREMVEFYNRIALEHPAQQFYDEAAYAAFFRHVAKQGVEDIVVLELGGWKGELAGAMLEKFGDIAAWHNYEISEVACRQAACADPRYRPLVPGDFTWNVALPAAHVFVSSHTIEHIRLKHLEALLDNLPESVCYAALQAPLAETGTDWTHYDGTHILEVGWREVVELMRSRGFAPIPALSRGEFRAFARGLDPGEAQGATVGLAMIVRDEAETVNGALGAFWGAVDEVAVVLGGASGDETEQIARGWCASHERKTGAPYKIEDYAGELDGDGRLLDFAEARQQATELLATDWMIVVDADDEWHGVGEHLRDLVRDADEAGFTSVQFPYHYDGGQFLQPRLFRRDSGYWRWPVHECWDFHPGRARALKTGLIWLEQIWREPGKARREGQNILIAERWLAAHEDGESGRVLAHLGKDYLIAGRAEDALDVLQRYLVAHGTRGDKHEVFEVHYCRAAALLRLDRYADAAQAALMALGTLELGVAWAALAEALVLMGEATGGRGVLELGATCAGRALELGPAQVNFWTGKAMTGAVALEMKGRALARLGRRQEALAALELARELGAEGLDGLCGRLRDGLGVV